MPFCQQCGTQLNDTSNFCIECGTKIRQPNTTAIQQQAAPANSTEQASATTQQQQPASYIAPNIKTPLYQGEAVIIKQLCTIYKGTRDSGYIILTNMRLLWEKSTAINAVGKGLLSLASNNTDLAIPLQDITYVTFSKALAAAGLEIATRYGERYKFACNSPNPFTSKPKNSRNQIVEYISKYIKQ